MPPSMPSEPLSLRYQGSIVPPMVLANAQVVNYVFLDKILLHRPICHLCCVFFSYDLRLHIIKRRMPNCTTVVQTASDLLEHEIRLSSPKK